jgi:hypothetical protein
MIGAMRGGKQMGPVSELITYHGSPHRFPPTANNPLGEFDPTKIGTGEGAQAYGHGAGYLAEAKGVGQGYAESLAMAQGKPLVVRKDGKIFKEGDQLTSDILDGLKYLEKGKKDAGQFPHNTQYYARIAAEKIPNDAYRARVMNAINELEGTTHAYEKTKGSLYKVDLPDEQIAKMLDWDKPLSQQPRGVQDALANSPIVQKVLADFQPEYLSRATGKHADKKYSSGMNMDNLYAHVRDALGGQAEASQHLRELGIPGIRYLDQGSRNVGTIWEEGGKWYGMQADTKILKQFGSDAKAAKVWSAAEEARRTSNFVVFDPKHMNIIERDGLTLEQALARTVPVKAKTGYAPKNIADQKINNPASAWRDSDLLQFANQNAASALVRGNLNMTIKELSGGKLLLEHSPMWGSTEKPFYIVGNDVGELVSLAIPRLERSNKSVEAAKKSKFDNSLLGKLTAEYGDTFSTAKSGRSESNYITHEPSGTKIRISEHNLPLGYVQPDVDLRIWQSLDEQLAEIRKVLE